MKKYSDRSFINLSRTLRRITLIHATTVIVHLFFDKTSKFYNNLQFLIFKFDLIFREVVLIGGESVKDQIRQLQDGVCKIGNLTKFLALHLMPDKSGNFEELSMVIWTN